MRVGLVYTETDAWALSVRVLSAVLKAAGHHTTIVRMPSEAPAYSDEALASAGRALEDCELVGLSSLSRGADRAAQVGHYLRERGKTVIWGGVHATLNPEDCAANADIVCVGEGEEALLEVVERLERGEPWHDVRNLVFKHDGRLVVNALRPLQQDLDRLPGPDLSCESEFELRDDTLERCSHVSDRESPGLMSIIASRGCAFHCTYCCNGRLKEIHQGAGRYLRRTTPARYVQLIEGMRSQCPGGKFFFFVDEDFFARPVEEIREFARLYSERVGLPFECCASAPFITEEKVRVLSEAGLWRIRIGLESGSDRTKREVYKRRISNDMVLKAARIVARFPQVVLCYFIIIGNPFEEADDLRETARFIAELPHGGTVWPFNLVFFPGSELYDRALESGVISGKASSGSDLDYRSGFEYHTLSWKQRNLYLNTVLYLMEGKTTKTRVGVVPRFLLPVLLEPSVVAWNERTTVPSQLLVAAKTQAWRVRKRIARALKATLKNPTAVYGARRFASVLRNRVRPGVSA